MFLFTELRLEVMEELFRLDHTGSNNTTSSAHAVSINGGNSGTGGPCTACSELSSLG